MNISETQAIKAKIEEIEARILALEVSEHLKQPIMAPLVNGSKPTLGLKKSA